MVPLRPSQSGLHRSIVSQMSCPSDPSPARIPSGTRLDLYQVHYESSLDSDILAFFNGAPDGSSPGRDDLAEEIARNGLEFADTQWRYVCPTCHLAIETLLDPQHGRERDGS